MGGTRGTVEWEEGGGRREGGGRDRMEDRGEADELFLESYRV
jgi:hypothetical protein